jgi:hypothetical protein
MNFLVTASEVCGFPDEDLFNCPYTSLMDFLNIFRLKSRLPWNRRSAIATALILASFLAAFILASEANQSTSMWAAAKDLPAGKVLESSDLTLVRATLAKTNGRYFPQSRKLIGSRIRVAVGAQELIAASAVTSAVVQSDTRSLPIRVARNDFPADLQVNQRVDLFALPMSGASNEFSAVAIASGITIESIDQRSKDYGSDVGIVVSVPQNLVYQVVANLANTRVLVVRDGL